MHRFPTLLLFAATLSAQEHADFSGRWMLSGEESDFSGAPAPKNRMETIHQEGANLTESVKQVSDEGEENYTLRFTTDGRPSRSSSPGGDVELIGKWDGQDLLIRSTLTGKDTPSTMNDRWSLSLDHNKITVTRHFEGQGIRRDQMLIYRKQ